jgi:hypothetical protein
MKKIVLIALCISSGKLTAQTSEDFIPVDASAVLSINNLQVLQKVSLDELVQYQFMEEIYAELFDGSTSGKSLKEVGIDFSQKINVFYGKYPTYELSGFSFGIESSDLLFKAFDDFEIIPSKTPGVTCYKSLFNRLYITGNTGVIVRINPTNNYVNEQTDSIWFARGNQDPMFFDYHDEMYDDEGNLIETQIDETEVDNIEDLLIEDGDGIDENDENPNETAGENPNTKTYYELRDSVELAIQNDLQKKLIDGLFVQKNNLKNKNAQFAERLAHNADAIVYIDNSKNFKGGRGFWLFQSVFPVLYEDMDQLYMGNATMGDLFLRENSIDMQLEMVYNETLGSIYKELNNTHFDKNVLKYIPKNNLGFITYNIDLAKGYEKAYETIMPLAKKETGFDVAATVLVAELMDEFINKKTLFNTYKGSMFGVFNGIQKIKTKRIEYVYNDNFEYVAQEVEREENIPVFTLGFSTKRNDIPEKILDFFHKRNTNISKEGDYWVVKNGFINSLPLYIINRNNLFIVTNDILLARDNTNGYGKNQISGAIAKAATKSKFIYSYMNAGIALEQFPETMFSADQNELLSALRGKAGILEMSTSKSTKTNTKVDINYVFSSAQPNAGKYLLDLINSIYIITK